MATKNIEVMSAIDQVVKNSCYFFCCWDNAWSACAMYISSGGGFREIFAT